MALLVLDASVVIAFLDENDGHHDQAVRAIRAARRDELVLPASAFSEVLVGAYRKRGEASGLAEAFVWDFAVRVHPIDAEVGRRAARLRARFETLRLADALVLAVADVLGGEVITADRAWSKVAKRVR